MCLIRPIENFWLWYPQENICGNRNLPFPCLYIFLNESHKVWTVVCSLQPLKRWVIIKKPGVEKDISILWLFFPSPKIFQGPWQENTGCLFFSLSQILCKYLNRFNYHKQECYFKRPTDSHEDAFEDLDPMKISATWNGSTVNCVRTIIRAQKEPLRLWGVRFQVEKRPKTSRNQEITKCVAVLHQRLSCQAALAFQDAVTKAAQWRLISEKGSSPYVFVAIRKYKM